MKQEAAVVLSTQELMPDIHLTWFDCPEIAVDAMPGQFVMVQCGEGLLLRRPISIHRRMAGSLALLYQVIGKGTEWLAMRRPGDEVDLLGPLGNGFAVNEGTASLLLVGGGIGIAPLIFLAEEAGYAGHTVYLAIGAATVEMLYPEELLPARSICLPATDDGSAGFHGLVTDCIGPCIGEIDQVFACGPLPMFRTLSRQRDGLLQDKPVQVSLELRMGCGFGVCYGCTVQTVQGLKQVCKDGPVFSIDDVCWDSEEFLRT